MSADHKAALAAGRAQGRAVRAYLEAVTTAGTPGRKVDPGTLKQRLQDVQSQIAIEADPVRRLDLIQQRLDLEDRLAAAGDTVDLAALEAEFVEVAKAYSDRKGITYTAWRESGVPASVLKAAGVPRTRRTST